MFDFRSFNRFVLVGLALLGLSVSSVNAAVVTVSLDGDGFLCPSGTCSSVGASSMQFTYDTALFSLADEIAFPAGTGKLFSTPDIAITLIGGGTSYSAGRVVGASIFDQPAAHDQFNFIYGLGMPLLQWNDFTSTSFSDPLPGDFTAVSALLIGQIESNPNLVLANAGFTLRGINGDTNLEFVMRNASLDIAIAAVPAPAAAWLFGTMLLGFAAYRKRFC